MVPVRNSGERAGREVVQVYLEGPDDDPSSPLRVLAGFAIIDTGLGEHAEARSPASTKDCPGGSGTLGSTGCTPVGRRGHQVVLR